MLMHISDWYTGLATLAGVPDAALASASASGPFPLDSFDVLGGLLSPDTCGAGGSAASPRKELMYFFGDDDNGAYGEGDYKIVLGIDHRWGLWDQPVKISRSIFTQHRPSQTLNSADHISAPLY